MLRNCQVKAYASNRGPTCRSSNAACIGTCSWMLDDVWLEKICFNKRLIAVKYFVQHF